MKGSEFIAAFGDKSLAAWEAAAAALARSGDVVSWPTFDLHLKTPDGAHTATLPVAADLFAIGTADDFIRLPLTPRVAQTIANEGGYLLPTPKLSYEIFKQATTRLRPIQSGALPKPFTQNLGASMGQYAAHNAAIQAQLGQVQLPTPYLVTGHKKDVVVSNIAKPKMLLIYGWFWPDLTRPYKESMDMATSQPIQPRSNFHGDFYVDYSHGIRFVSPQMTVDGQVMNADDVYRDPILSKLVSDEGPLHFTRYPANNNPHIPVPQAAAAYHAQNQTYMPLTTPSLVDVGAGVIAAAALKNQP